MRIVLRAALAVGSCCLGIGGRGSAQQVTPDDGHRLLATRPALAAMLQRLQQKGPPGEATLVRARLTEGDFQPGDRILLLVEGEKELSDTFTVGPQRDLLLPNAGTVSLQGVLRSELEDDRAGRIATSVRAPVVRARTLVRVSVQGEVAKPGFYTVPADAVVSEALVAAGGTMKDAKITALRIERGGQAVWEKARLQRALAEGRTLDQMNLRQGDEFVVPRGDRKSTRLNSSH